MDTLFLISTIYLSYFYFYVAQSSLLHLSESFTTKDRLEVFSYAFIVGKFVAGFAPFIIEYLKDDEFFLVMIASTFVLMYIYFYQEETFGKPMEDD